MLLSCAHFVAFTSKNLDLPFIGLAFTKYAVATTYDILVDVDCGDRGQNHKACLNGLSMEITNPHKLSTDISMVSGVHWSLQRIVHQVRTGPYQYVIARIYGFLHLTSFTLDIITEALAGLIKTLDPNKRGKPIKIHVMVRLLYHLAAKLKEHVRAIRSPHYTPASATPNS